MPTVVAVTRMVPVRAAHVTTKRATAAAPAVTLTLCGLVSPIVQFCATPPRVTR